MAENRKRNRTAASRKSGYTPKEVKFSDITEDENQLDPAPDEKEHSISRRVFVWGIKILIFAILLTVAGLVYRAWTPQNLSDIAGYGETETNPVVQNLPALLKKAQEGNYPLVLSEKDINLYLSNLLRAKQEGPMGVLARYKGVAVRLYDGYAEIIVVRTIGDKYEQTSSLYISPESLETGDGPVIVTDYARPDLFGTIPIGGRIGKLPVPQGYLVLSQPAFVSMKEALEPELEYLLDPHRPIVIKRGRLEIQPSRRAEYY